MATAYEHEKNNTPKTASGNHVISEYNGNYGRYYFESHVQNTGPEHDPIDAYDPVDYFSFRHFEGLKKVNFNLSPSHFGDDLSTREAGVTGQLYSMTITPSGAFDGNSITVTIKTGIANYQDEWYAANQDFLDLNQKIDETRSALLQAGKDTTRIDNADEKLEEISDLFLSMREYDEINFNSSTARKLLTDILNEKVAYEFRGEIQELGSDIMEMVKGWDKDHFYLGTRQKEATLSELSERTTWKVDGSGAGFVAFSGGTVKFKEGFYDFDFVEADVSKNWYLQVQSESRPRRDAGVESHEHHASSTHDVWQSDALF